MLTLTTTINAQTLNQNANWPNTNWTVSGTYTAAGLLSDPRSSANFTFSDDAAGQTSLSDEIFANSPTINLVQAEYNGETLIEVSGSVIFESDTQTDSLTIEYYDAGAGNWVVWHRFASQTVIFPTFDNCLNPVAFTTPQIDISSYTVAQLVGFKYRIHYSDDGGWEYGFCMTSTTIRSLAPTVTCQSPSALTANNVTTSTADLNWTENGTATLWDIELVTSGSTSTGLPTTSGINAKPYTASALTPGTAYDYYVRSDCGGGDVSAWEGPFTFTTQAIGGCIDPSTMSATSITSSSADLNWSENGVATLWDIELLLNAATPTGIATQSGISAKPYTASGLFSGTDYKFYVRSDCGGSASNWVGPFGFTTLVGSTCSDPSTLSASNIGSSSADLSWTENGTATTWDLEIVTSGTTPTGTATNAMITNNPFNATGLSPATAYDFYVRSDCGSGLSSWVGPFTFTTLAGNTCSDPSALNAQGITTTTANLNWTENGTSNTWDLEVIPAGNTPSGTPTESGISTQFYNKTGLTPSTAYDFYVRSDCGGSYSAWVGPYTFTTTGGSCANPSGLSAQNVTWTTANLKWTENGSANNWELEVMPSPFNPSGTATHTASIDPEISLSNLMSGITYKYYVRSSCGGTHSTWIGPEYFVTNNDLSELENDLDLKLFPNPTKGIINLEFNTQGFEDVKILVRNIAGRAIMTKPVTVASQVQESFNLSELSGGIYLLEIQTEKGSIIKRVVKQ